MRETIKDKTRLLHILKAIQKVEEYVEGKNKRQLYEQVTGYVHPPINRSDFNTLYSLISVVIL